LFDDQQAGTPALSAQVVGGNDPSFITFSDFPLRADQVTQMDSCNYRLTIINGDKAQIQVGDLS
jgi:hypothetical protein